MIGIYTALFGNYDNLLPTKFGGIVFTDQDIGVDGWEVHQVSLPHPDPRYSSRFYFTQSSYVMPQYEYTIMHGANSQLIMKPDDLVAMLPPDIDIGVFRHPHRDNVYDEAKACIKYRKDKKEIIETQMSRYRDEDFDGDGLSACILIVRRNTPKLQQFETMWWSEVVHNSCRDQLSFDYCRWKLDIPVFYLPLGWNRVFRVGKHK
jgi:hypothetical protein